MHRLIILASVVMLAASSVNCANSPERSNANILGPSASDGGSATVMPAGKGGGGKPGGGGTTAGGGSLTLSMVTDNNQNGLPNFGDTVTFIVKTTVSQPTVTLLCSQNGVGVYGATGGFYDSYPWPWTKNMTLSSSSWSGGAADCTATLTNLGSTSVLAKASFTAGQ